MIFLIHAASLWCHMKSLNYQTPVEPDEDMLAQVMTAAEVRLSGIGNRVHKNSLRRYRVCFEVAGRPIELFFKWIQKKNNIQLTAEVGEFKV